MHRIALFLSRLLLALWVVLGSAFILLLWQNAPGVPHTPFAGISIRTEQNQNIHLPNRIFICTETAQQFQCQATLEGQSLDLSLTKGKDYQYDLGDCRAAYGGRSIGCAKAGVNYAPILSSLYEIKNLPLSSQQIQGIQQKYWIRNVLVELGEDRLLWLCTGLALAAGVSGAFLAWLHPGHFSKVLASLACGFGVAHLTLMKLDQVGFDTVESYGISSTVWMGIAVGGAIGAGCMTGLATALLLWRNLNRFSRILISFSSSVGVFQLCWWSLMWNSQYALAFLGLAEQASGQNPWLMRLPTIASLLLAGIAALLLLFHTRQSIKRFLCISCGIGSIALTTYLLVFLLLGMGYVD